MGVWGRVTQLLPPIMTRKGDVGLCYSDIEKLVFP